eukprot:CAMPEP_0117440578 /NCGR_PEP_ID=MMETSP0759-20121206/3169_1 /TAXON_ID=63605 /ORGANISM="Percolomonas cosmopolitus, Strain WS" /LENGTH=143 /DNA_ID=CAMNT_0005232361 /DNA_START=43 /DNA_END=474 /DNA_ORIENTATION=+
MPKSSIPRKSIQKNKSQQPTNTTIANKVDPTKLPSKFVKDNYFCTECGSFLFAETSSPAECPVCNSKLRFQYENIIKYPIIEHTVKGPKKRTQDESKILIQYECPACGHPEMKYWVMQTRGADEGSTVFYECVKCRHTIKENN